MILSIHPSHRVDPSEMHKMADGKVCLETNPSLNFILPPSPGNTAGISE